MTVRRFPRGLRALLAGLLPISLGVMAHGQGAKKPLQMAPLAAADKDHQKERPEWFLRGRVIPGEAAAELRRRAYENKMHARVARWALARGAGSGQMLPATGGWAPLGPVPLASDGTGSGLQDYHQVSGRATSVAIDPADTTGNTVFIGGAQGGVWKSTNAAASASNNVTWTPITDDQATLAIGAIAIQPGNSVPSKSVVIVGTGEADSSADSYFGLGMLRSADGGNSWAPIITTANSGTVSFSGLGATRMAFSTAAGQTNTVVAAMAATGEGTVEGALTSNTFRGLFTSTDAGQTWTYDSLFAGGASEATSATSVAYNATAGLFFAALRYHGFYSSPDGITWTALANQPGAPGLLSATACPQNYLTTCPIYRGEISVVPGRNEMYVWFVSSDASGNPVDQGIWVSTNSGASWSQISDAGITNCGDFSGCGVEQGFYNLELLAVPNGAATDLYAGAINLYKCSISAINAGCAVTPFMNLTHVYGCDPLGAPAHVHPDQHALAYTIPASSAAALMYFANDGGIYRALNGFTGLSNGACSGANQFDDLNQNLGSMAQFVSFSQHPTNADMLFGGTQDNGSPATATATTNSSWGNVLSGDGGYSALDVATGNWYATNPDTGLGTLNIQECAAGTGCDDSLFNAVIGSGNLGGDDGGFYFPFILDPQSSTALLVGTCRVWQGPRTGGTFTALSLNFETFGTGTCAGTEENVVRALAAGGPTNASGSKVIYATTDGLGPNNPTTPAGGNVWVTTNAMAVSGTSSTFANVTSNGPGGSSINSNQFPISSVAIDSSDPSGNTAYVTVMGFTGLAGGHVWQTTNAGASWTDYSGAGATAIPDAPANAVVIDPSAHMVYAGTDVGVFQSPASGAAWTEVGPIPGGGQSGFLPNVAVTALALFNSGGQKLLRASTYGRGVWQYNLLALPDFAVAVSNTPLTVFPGTSAIFNGTLTAINGYNNNVGLSCTAGLSNPPVPCTPSPVTLAPTPAGAAFSLTASAGGVADYFFNVQGLGTDPKGTTHLAALTLHVVNFSLTMPSPNSVTDPRGAPSAPVSFQVAGQGSFNQSVTLSCNAGVLVSGATCSFTPSATFNVSSAMPVNATATVTMPGNTPVGNYTITIQASTAGAAAPLSTTFAANVVINPDFVLTETAAFPNVKAGSTGTTGPITVSSQDGFTGPVSLSCVSTFGTGSCSIAPTLVNSFPATATLTINGTSFTPGSYQVSVMGTSGGISHSLPVPFSVGDYTIVGTQALAGDPGGTATANLTFTSVDSYSGSVNMTCDATALPGAQCTLAPAGPVTVGSGAAVAVTATVSMPNNAVAGSYNIKINTQDATGEPLHAWTIALAVQDFSLGPVTPPAQTVAPGQSAIYNLSVTPAGNAFAGAVSLSCSGAPANSTCSFAPNPVTPGGGAASVGLTISTSGTIMPGTYNMVVAGASGVLTHSTPLALTISNTANNLQLAVSQAFPGGADAGSQQSAKILLTPNYTGSVTASCDTSALPGTQCTLNPANPIVINGSPLIITAVINIPSNAAPGAYNINLNVQDTGPGGTPRQSLTLPLTVIQDFTLSTPAPATQTIKAGQSASYNLSVLPIGAAFDASVNLSCSGGPVISLCSFTPSSVMPGNSSAAVVMTISTTANAAGISHPRMFYALWLALPGLALLRRRAKFRAPAYLTGLFLLAFMLASCGGGGSNGGGSGGGGGGQQLGTQPGTYTITVTGTSGTLNHAAAPVTLIVN